MFGRTCACRRNGHGFNHSEEAGGCREGGGRREGREESPPVQLLTFSRGENTARQLGTAKDKQHKQLCDFQNKTF